MKEQKTVYWRIFTLFIALTVITATLPITFITSASHEISGKVLSYPLPILGGNEQIAKDYKDVIKDLEDIEPGRKTCYVTKEGSGNKSGLSDLNSMPFETMVKRLNPLSNYNPDGFDTILLKRGQEYRTNIPIRLKGNMRLGAYGEGAKPKILGSLKNYNKDWRATEVSNVWKLKYIGSDIGVLLINESMPGRKCLSKSEIAAINDFYHDATNNILYLCSDVNPNTFNSIEIGSDTGLISVVQDVANIEEYAENVFISNIDLRYVGGHAIHYNRPRNGTITGCEIGWVGGSKHMNTDTLYGNGIELWGDVDNVIVKDNYVYQIYDAGITFQGSGTFKNITFEKNLIEYSSMGIEYWDSSSSNGTYGYDNIVIKENVIRFTGYGWGSNKVGGEGRMGHINTGWKHMGNGEYTTLNVTIKNNIFDTSYQTIFRIPLLGNEAEKYTITGNSYYQRSRKGANVLGYSFAQVNENAAFLYGECDEMSITHTASSQSELELAVYSIDENPAEVVWSYGSESMIRLTETAEGNGRLYQNVNLPTGDYVLQSYIDGNTTTDLWVLNPLGEEIQGTVKADKNIMFYTTEFSVERPGTYKVGYSNVWTYTGQNSHLFGAELYLKTNANVNLLTDPNNADSWKIDYQNGSGLVAESIAENGYFNHASEKMLVINETHGGNGGFYQNVTLKPGNYEFTSYVVGSRVSFKPVVKGGTPYTEKFTTEQEDNFHKISFTVEDADVYTIGFMTDQAFAGETTYIYNVKLCQNNADTNLLETPNRIYSWIVKHDNSSDFTIETYTYDNRFDEKKMLAITGSGTDTFSQNIDLQGGKTYHYSAFVDAGNYFETKPTITIFKPDWSETLDLKINYDSVTKIQTIDFTPKVSGKYPILIQFETGWHGENTMQRCDTAYYYNIKLCAEGSGLNLLNDTNNAASWYDSVSNGGLSMTSIEYDYRFDMDIPKMVQFNVTSEGTTHFYQEINLSPGTYVYELNYDASTEHYLPKVLAMHKDGWLADLNALSNGMILSSGINEKTGKYTIEFEVKNQLENYDYLLTVSNSAWCFIGDVITIYDAKLYNIKDSEVNLLTNANIDSDWGVYIENGSSVTKRTRVYDYRFDSDVTKLMQVTATTEQIKFKSSQSFVLPKGEYIVEGVLDAAGTSSILDIYVHLDGWNCEASTLNAAGSYDIELGVESITGDGFHSRKFTVNNSLPIQILAVNYTAVNNAITAYNIVLYKADDVTKTNLLCETDKSIENWEITGGIKHILTYDGRYGQNTLGDVNGDDFVNVLDLVRMKKRLSGMKLNGFFINNADINGDKRIISSDLVQLRKILLYK